MAKNKNMTSTIKIRQLNTSNRQQNQDIKNMTSNYEIEIGHRKNDEI